MNTGNSFRSSDLGVMSPARCLCAMPVKQRTMMMMMMIMYERTPFTLYSEKKTLSSFN